MVEIQDYINENNVIKDKIYKEFKFSISCPICLNILYEPMMCSNCQHAYCRSCISKWNKIKRNCPNRCKNPNYQFCIAKNELLSKLKFKCNYCENIYDYKNMKNHYFSEKNNRNSNSSIFRNQIIKGIFEKIENKEEQLEPKNKIKSKKIILNFL